MPRAYSNSISKLDEGYSHMLICYQPVKHVLKQKRYFQIVDQLVYVCLFGTARFTTLSKHIAAVYNNNLHHINLI